MIRFRRAQWTIASVVTVLMLASCGGADGADGSATIAFIQYADDDPVLAASMRDGVKLAVKHANDKSSGTTIHLKELVETERASRSNDFRQIVTTPGPGGGDGKPVEVPEFHKRYLTDQKIVGAIGQGFDARAFEEANLVGVKPAVASAHHLDAAEPDTIYGLIPQPSVGMHAFARYLASRLQSKEVAYVEGSSAIGTWTSNQLMVEVERLGVRNIVNPTDPASVIRISGDDHSAAVAKIAQSKPDAVVLLGKHSEAATLRKQLVEAGIAAEFLAYGDMPNAGFIEIAGTQANGSTILCLCHVPTSESAGAAGEFARAFEAEFGTGPGPYAAEAFDAANILIDAAKAGVPDRTGVVMHMSRLASHDGITKRIQFDQRGNARDAEVFAYEVRDGRYVQLHHAASR